jgi:hypothetical protein
MSSPNWPTNTRLTKDQLKDQATCQAPAHSPHGVQPSGPRGDNPATAGPGPTNVRSGTPENRLGHINPSAPEDANTTRPQPAKSDPLQRAEQRYS